MSEQVERSRELRWFDGHLDLTYIADHGRDLTRAVGDCGGSLLPATVTFPSLRAGGVTDVISTIFVCRRVAGDAPRGIEAEQGPYCYDSAEEAYAAGVRQVRMHEAWEENAKCEMRNAKWGRTKDERQKTKGGEDPLRVVLAIEGAACLRGVEDLQFFYDAGVRMVSLAWAEGSAWAGGDRSGGDVTAAGRALIERLDALGCVHDVSHLSERAFWTVMERAKGAKVASHSNCRALLSGAKSPERHLSDDQIRALVAGGGVIGINLYARFLLPEEELKVRRATVADVIRHMEHMSQVAGRRDFLALGSDMDGGFGANLLPSDLEGPHELGRLAESLSEAGWGDEEIAGFAGRWGSVVGS